MEELQKRRQKKGGGLFNEECIHSLNFTFRPESQFNIQYLAAHHSCRLAFLASMKEASLCAPPPICQTTLGWTPSVDAARCRGRYCTVGIVSHIPICQYSNIGRPTKLLSSLKSIVYHFIHSATLLPIIYDSM